ncbi:MAG TPA: 5-(carboxyamino)imidazole ribonucleotide mutase [Luteolibacter sp.]|nr:5-(carboxyamino)imidazole ribonucleotide mutase [Luteolibacter sp.]
MSSSPQVAIVMGSASDWPIMEHAARTLRDFGIPWVAEVASAHRSLDKLQGYIGPAREKGYKCVIAGAGAAAHLAGVCAAITDIPVCAVPIDSTSLKGLDALLAMVQMPGGIPVATFAIGKAGAVNAALFAVAMIANEDREIATKLAAFRKAQSDKVKAATLPPLD